MLICTEEGEKMIEQIIEDIKKNIVNVINKYPINKAAIFGSYANGTNKRNSDIDILVNFSSPMGMFEFLELKENLEDVLKKKVDLLTYKSLESSYIKDEILKGAIEIYAKR